METVILKCSCRHEYQDETYGEGMRLHNWAPGSKKTDVRWRCTVCGLTRGGPDIKRK